MKDLFSFLCKTQAGRVIFAALAVTVVSVTADLASSIGGSSQVAKVTATTSDLQTSVSLDPEEKPGVVPIQADPKTVSTGEGALEVDSDVRLVMEETGLTGIAAEVTADLLEVRRGLTRHVLDGFSSAEEAIVHGPAAAEEVKGILKKKSMDILRTSGATQSEIDKAWAFLADGVDSNLGGGKYRF